MSGYDKPKDMNQAERRAMRDAIALRVLPWCLLDAKKPTDSLVSCATRAAELAFIVADAFLAARV